MLIVFLIGYLVGISQVGSGVSPQGKTESVRVEQIRDSRQLMAVKSIEAATVNIYRVAVSDSPVARTIQPMLVSRRTLSSSDQLDVGTINEKFMGI